MHQFALHLQIRIVMAGFHKKALQIFPVQSKGDDAFFRRKRRFGKRGDFRIKCKQASLYGIWQMNGGSKIVLKGRAKRIDCTWIKGQKYTKERKGVKKRKGYARRRIGLDGTNCSCECFHICTREQFSFVVGQDPSDEEKKRTICKRGNVLEEQIKCHFDGKKRGSLLDARKGNGAKARILVAVRPIT